MVMTHVPSLKGGYDCALGTKKFLDLLVVVGPRGKITFIVG
jgi:hypothetical protein